MEWLALMAPQLIGAGLGALGGYVAGENKEEERKKLRAQELPFLKAMARGSFITKQLPGQPQTSPQEVSPWGYLLSGAIGGQEAGKGIGRDMMIAQDPEFMKKLMMIQAGR